MHKCRCPYCYSEMDDPDDCYDPEETYEHECPHCGKNFVFTVDYITTYREKAADCLNGGDHKFEPSQTAPKRFTRMICSQCNNERPCTDDEMAQVLSEC